MKVVSVNIGQRKTVSWNGRQIETGIYKFPVDLPIYLDVEEVKNDAIVDRKYHGGVDKAVYAYSENHYAYWKALYPDLEWTYGMFGENLTVSNLEETDLRVGDIYQLGGALIEVSEPRQPCMKLGIRFGTQKILKQFWLSTKSGAYFKVVQMGKVQIGDEILLQKTDKTKPTIAEIYISTRKSKGI
jgi:MOSC domain-containing protein YiiM